MTIGLTKFRQVIQSSNFEQNIKLKDDGQSLGTGSALASRFKGWLNKVGNALGFNVAPRTDPLAQKYAVKEAFYQALVKTEGKEAANRALSSAGLSKKEWKTDGTPLTTRTVAKVLDHAQQYRLKAVKENESKVNNVIENLRTTDPDCAKAVHQALVTHSDFGARTMGDDEINTLVENAKNAHAKKREALCEEQYPALTKLAREMKSESKDIRLDARTLLQDLKTELKTDSKTDVGKALALMEKSTKLLGKTAWTHTKMVDLIRTLDKHISDLRGAQTTLKRGVSLQKALHQDIDRQIKTLESKQAFVESLRKNNPLSMAGVAHSNLVWSQACSLILKDINKDGYELQQMNTASLEVEGECRKWQDKIEEYQTYNEQIDAPTKENKSTHPITKGKQEIIENFRATLRNAGVSEETIKKLTSDSAMKEAQRRALCECGDWTPISNEMVVTKDGVTRTYTSNVTPGANIHAPFARNYGNQGVSAATTTDLQHARNLKVSELIGPDGSKIATVVGHGVLDMWNITDPEQRRLANEAGANEVIQTALATNDRARKAALNGKPVKLTHVSVNLISPDVLRDALGVSAYQERTYTENQNKAFVAQNGTQNFQMYDENDQEKSVKVDVDTITFSFGINKIATNETMSTLMGTWSTVHAHNTANMIKLIGDLGDTGSDKSGARGARPGGFIGEVYDRLETAGMHDEMGKLRAQTDLVRTMFNNEDFKRGNGDPAKMGREILVLQTMAEQALGKIEVDPESDAPVLAATMSKGCKSDKDRGGVTDVELKSSLIIRDMGGTMRPDEILEGDDQQIYYTVSGGSGQIENQRWNTGTGGSKEIGHLGQRVPDLQVMQYLAGTGLFAAA